VRGRVARVPQKGTQLGHVDGFKGRLPLQTVLETGHSCQQVRELGKSKFRIRTEVLLGGTGNNATVSVGEMLGGGGVRRKVFDCWKTVATI